MNASDHIRQLEDISRLLVDIDCLRFQLEIELAEIQREIEAENQWPNTG